MGAARVSARLAGSLVVALLLTVSGPVAGTATAAVEPDPDLLEISNELADSGLRLRELQIALQTAGDAVAGAVATSTAAGQRRDDLAREQGRAQARVAATEAQLRDLVAESEVTKAKLARLVRDQYLPSELDPIWLLADIGSLDEYSDRLRFARVARRSQDADLALAVDQEAALRATITDLRGQADAIESLQTRARIESINAEAAQLAATTAQAELRALVDDQATTVATFEAARQAEEDRLAELSANSRTLARQLALLADEDSYNGALAGTRGIMAYPVAGRISSPFGNRLHPILNYVRLHTGIDLAAACGTPVRAAADGIVVSAGTAGGYGNQLVLSHGRVAGVPVATTYNHLSEFAVTSGQVRKGETIAFVGTTGLSTGCHLHFETREAGEPVDPLNWLQ